MYLEFIARICSSKVNPSNSTLKLSSTGSAFCSISVQGTLLNDSILYNSVFVQLSIMWQCDTVLFGRSVRTALRLRFCLRYHSCSSDGILTSSV